MAGAKEIRTKIKSVQNTQKITKAMEMVAASKMRKAQERMRASRPYAEKMRDVLSHLAQAHCEYKHPYLQDREEVKRVGYIVVSTDRGLCGGLNTNMFKAAINEMSDWHDKNVEIDICAIGKKSATFVPDLPKAGRYEVRMAHNSNVRRANAVPVTIRHADGESIVKVNEGETAPIGKLFRSLGTFRFKKGRSGLVTIGTAGTEGKYGEGRIHEKCHTGKDGQDLLALRGDHTQGSESFESRRDAYEQQQARRRDGIHVPGKCKRNRGAHHQCNHAEYRRDETGKRQHRLLEMGLQSWAFPLRRDARIEVGVYDDSDHSRTRTCDSGNRECKAVKAQ